MNDKEILTAKDIAVILGVTERTARRIIAKHKLGMMIGKRWIVSKRKFLELIESGGASKSV